MRNKIKESKAIITQEVITNKIFFIRSKKVMLDSDLAELYGVPTKSLNLAVKRNLARFPKDFMFHLTKDGIRVLRFQSETSKKRRGGRRYLPYAFTQEGVAMLSSVLNSERAIQVNIQIMRTFSWLRELMLEHRDLREKIEKLERKYNYRFKVVFEAIKKLLESPRKPKYPIGFQSNK